MADKIARKVGRPTRLTPEMMKKAHGYLATKKDEIDENGKMRKVDLPSIADLSLYLQVNRDILYDWEGKNEEFRGILREIKAEQEKRLLNCGLSGQYNSNIAKLVLGKHDYHDRSDITSGGQKLGLAALLTEADEQKDR